MAVQTCMDRTSNLLTACVVDTARQKYVAMTTHKAAAKRDTSMPKAKILHVICTTEQGG